VLHSNTQGLIDHWRALRRGALAPSRKALDPAAISEILTQVFLLGVSQPDLPFRLAGGLVVDLHGKTLRGEGFLNQWTSTSRPQARDAAMAALRERQPLVIYAEALAKGGVMGLEILLAPLAGPDGEPDRLLGLYQPLAPLAVTHDEAIGPLVHRTVVRLGHGPAQAPRLRLAAVDGTRL
jgi:hypothetical protein